MDDEAETYLAEAERKAGADDSVQILVSRAIIAELREMHETMLALNVLIRQQTEHVRSLDNNVTW